MKKILKCVVLIFTCIVLFTGCSKSDNHIIEISLDEFKEKIANKDTFALYVGNDGCTHCIAYMPTLESVLDEYDITIYHLDNSKLSDKEYADFKTYINISGTPTIAFITDGEEETTLNRIVGEQSKEDTIERFKNNGYIDE
ncbi:MAG TPA: thioredoxin family protein [Candidatus Aphodocola excrementigallinarum]|uniref:Thioredoxin family protein n=1 Tax=Candidatus Aphodocola excrementigallinarum TaxID=2840670 RepID=A0A9D1IMA1_9FIRM|nr:thioredoxin family protein [Candidatus Aphodocola excrementigallinarum]